MQNGMATAFPAMVNFDGEGRFLLCMSVDLLETFLTEKMVSKGFLWVL